MPVSPGRSIGQNTFMDRHPITPITPMTPAAPRRLARSAARCLAFLLALLLPAAPAMAREQLYATVEQFLLTQTRGLPGQVSVSVGQLDPRLQLAACSAYEPFQPPGAQFWGRTNVGVRCLGPANWTIYLTAQVQVIGSYVVTARPLNSGQPLTSEDMALQRGDLTAMPAGILTEREQAIGKTLRNALGGGQPLRSDMLIAPFVIQQGQDVRLVTQGRGFSASNDGKALNNAAEGQVARARTANGQTVSGIARPGGIIEVIAQ